MRNLIVFRTIAVFLLLAAPAQAKLIGADMSTTSKHLSQMKAAGIVEDEKRGAQVFYSLRVPCVLNFFSCVETVLKSSANEALERQQRLADGCLHVGHTGLELVARRCAHFHGLGH